jgi:hypothetical protein
MKDNLPEHSANWTVSDEHLEQIFREAGKRSIQKKWDFPTFIGFLGSIGEAGIHGWSIEKIRAQVDIGKSEANVN